MTEEAVERNIVNTLLTKQRKVVAIPTACGSKPRIKKVLITDIIYVMNIILMINIHYMLIFPNYKDFLLSNVIILLIPYQSFENYKYFLAEKKL